MKLDQIKSNPARNAAYTLVALGNEEVMDNLIEALKTKGSREMAAVYLSCGEVRLATAARSSVFARNSKLAADEEGVRVKWGQW